MGATAVKGLRPTMRVTSVFCAGSGTRDNRNQVAGRWYSEEVPVSPREHGERKSGAAWIGASAVPCADTVASACRRRVGASGVVILCDRRD